MITLVMGEYFVNTARNRRFGVEKCGVSTHRVSFVRGIFS